MRERISYQGPTILVIKVSRRNWQDLPLGTHHPRKQEDDQDSSGLVAFASSVPGLIPSADVIHIAGR